MTRGVGLIDGGMVTGILVGGLVNTVLAVLLWNHALQVFPASMASLTFFTPPVTGTLLETLFVGRTR